MIDRLTGRVLRKNVHSAVLDVGGIGFDLQVSLTTLESLPAVGSEATLFISVIWRSESLMLAGFSDEAEREIFVLLIGVSGVGPRIALAMLSHLGASGILHALQENESAVFARTPGVGKKLSERIALDLRDKIKQFDFASSRVAVRGRNEATSLSEDGVKALESLGFSQREADAAFAKVLRENPATDLPKAIRLALRELGTTK
ncbi:MAG: Holliday junction branch migration protein RuvA [Acidobacteriota bacterium]